MTQDKNLRVNEQMQSDEEEVPFIMDAFERNLPSSNKVQHVQLRGESPQSQSPDGNNDLDVT